MNITLNPISLLSREEYYVLSLNHVLGVEVTFLHNRQYKSNILSVDKNGEWGPIAFLADGTSTFLNALLLHDGNKYVTFAEYTRNVWDKNITHIEIKHKQLIDRFKVKISDISNLPLVGAPSHGF